MQYSNVIDIWAGRFRSFERVEVNWLYFLLGPLNLPLVGYLPFLSPQIFNQFTSLSEKYGDIFSLNMGSYRLDRHFFGFMTRIPIGSIVAALSYWIQ